LNDSDKLSIDKQSVGNVTREQIYGLKTLTSILIANTHIYWSRRSLRVAH